MNNMNALAALEEVYRTAECKSVGEFSPLPTGKYEAIVKQNQFDYGKIQFERKFQIVGGEFQGKIQTDWLRLFKNDGNANQVSIERLKSEVMLLNPIWEAYSLEDVIHPYCLESLDRYVSIYVSTKAGTKQDGSPTVNSSIYINEFLDGLPNTEDMPF